MSTVHRFLVTGTDERLTTFQILVCLLWNAIERREHTILYTALDEHKDFCLEHARELGLTVQERTKANNPTEGPPWATIIEGDLPGWEWTAIDEAEEPQCQ